MIFKGIAADVKMENIFYCADSDSVFMSTESEYLSPVTGKKTELIGWVESNDVNKAKEIEKILDSRRSRLQTLPDNTNINMAIAEGGNEVEKLNVTEATPVVEEAVAPEAPAEIIEEVAPVEQESAEVVAEETSAEVLEKSAELTTQESPDFVKMLGDLKGFFSETLEKASEANAAQVSTIKETVEAFSKNVDLRISELAEKHTELSTAVDSIKSIMDTVEKRVDAVESDTAIKKSSDLGGSAGVTIKKSKWNGTFLGSVSELTK
jgi:hypothetical protein